jgi:hypothetical protein
MTLLKISGFEIPGAILGTAIVLQNVKNKVNKILRALFLYRLETGESFLRACGNFLKMLASSQSLRLNNTR